jgi:hypothetical protein
MESQGDALMRRKAERQTAGAGDAEAAPKPSDAQAIQHSQNRHRQLSNQHGATNNATLPRISVSPRSQQWGDVKLPPYRRHLEAREAELQSFVEQQVASAIEEQRMDEALHAEACRRQRDVERMKLRQKTKRRLELQTAARQPVSEELMSSMGLQPPEHHRLSATAQHRRELRDVPAATFLEHNADRLTNAMVHREACREAELIKAQTRVAMEEYVGTDFAKRRLQMWERSSGRPADSVRCPTAVERRRGAEQTTRVQQTTAEETAEVRRAMEEMSRLDDAIRENEEKRLATAQRRQITKDVPFSVHAELRKPASSNR